MIVHVLPRNDLVAHEVNDDCVCGPLTSPVTDDDSDTVLGFVVIHSALDGRDGEVCTEAATIVEGG